MRKDGERKEESRKAHKESERDRRNIENACIQQLKSLTHPECYMNVKSKYRDEPAKNEILARGCFQYGISTEAELGALQKHGSGAESR